ncbi:hypothetical protein T06_14672 [Trichinella sp. T6]|nr:hypothetical protein T06_14672 [Trichinella sp. T6]
MPNFKTDMSRYHAVQTFSANHSKGAVGWDLSWKITMMRDLMESKNYNTASIISQAAHSILVISIIFDKSLLRYY